MNDDYELIGVPNGKLVRVCEADRLPGDEVEGSPAFTNPEEILWHVKRRTPMSEPDQAEDPHALRRMAIIAARFDAATKEYLRWLPRKNVIGDPKNDNERARPLNHASITDNVMTWVDYALAPNSRTGIEMRSVVTVDKMASLFRKREFGPFGTKSGQIAMGVNEKGEALDIFQPHSFVCIEHGSLTAELLRRLNYYAQDVNVVSGMRLRRPHPDLLRKDDIWTYQSVLVRVWFGFSWHYVDAFLHHQSLDETIGKTIRSSRTLTIYGMQVRESEIEFYRYAVDISFGDIVGYGAQTNRPYTRARPGPWEELQSGKYERTRGIYDRQYNPKRR